MILCIFIGSQGRYLLIFQAIPKKLFNLFNWWRCAQLKTKFQQKNQYFGIIYILFMYLTLKFAFCFAILFLATLSSYVNVTCSGQSSCDSGYAYHYRNHESEDFECTGSCNGLWMTLELFDCEVDYLEEKCKSGVCISQGEKQGVETCSDADNYCPQYYFNLEVNATCQKCQNTDCQNGLCVKVSGIQTCYKLDKCYFPWLGLTYTNCPSGYTVKGERCQCCHHFYSDRPIGVCSNDAPYDSPKLHEVFRKLEQKERQERQKQEKGKRDRDVKHAVNFYLSNRITIFYPFSFLIVHPKYLIQTIDHYFKVITIKMFYD